MIKYSLICKDCNLTFESWFGSSKEYEKLKRKNFLNCHNCNSTNIQKSLMAPSLIRKKSELSKVVAQKLAKKALEKNIKKIFFDRGIYKYHERVKIFAETLRENGMEF